MFKEFFKGKHVIIRYYYFFLRNVFFKFFGIEIPHDFGGAESSFFIANIVIEELAKVKTALNCCKDITLVVISSFYRSTCL